MKKLLVYADAFIVAGFVTSLLSGIVNPLYVSLILSKLDSKTISVGAFAASAFPFAIGLLFENRKLLDRLLAVLPVVMLAEVAAVVVSLFVATRDVATYYLVAMFIFGLFSTSVTFLLQRVKEAKYSADRAAFDRRSAAAEALGFLCGSGIAAVYTPEVAGPLTVALFGLGQTMVAYALLIIACRRVRAALATPVPESPKRRNRGGRSLSQPPRRGWPR